MSPSSGVRTERSSNTMMDENVLIIIIFHDERSFVETIETLRSLAGIQYSNYDIMVVNNGVHDKTLKTKIADSYPNVIYSETVRNLGFAGGNNVGIEYGLSRKHKYLLLLNNDVDVAPDFLNRLVMRISEHERVGMVGPKTFYYAKKDKVWAMGGYIIKWRALVGGLSEENRRVGEYFEKWRPYLRRLLGRGEVSHDNGQVDYLPASCILMKREVVEKVGKLPDEYFFAYEEAEYALRVKRAGYKIVVEPKAHIWHKVGLSSQRTPEWVYNSYRNRFVFLKRNFLFPFNLLLALTLFLGKFLRASAERRILIDAWIDHFKYSRIEEAHLLRIRRKYSR